MTFQSCLCGITSKTSDNPLGICSTCRTQALARARGAAPPWRTRIDGWRAAINKYLPWFLSFITLYSMVLIGQKAPSGWIVALAAQAFWLLWIWSSRTWGMLPMNMALSYVYFKNLLSWTA